MDFTLLILLLISTFFKESGKVNHVFIFPFFPSKTTINFQIVNLGAKCAVWLLFFRCF